ncbi:GNAT family N-acetyltransferase [Kitasatospora sp. NPDC002040]|uniref:GNAT family N-acetyltransferase n=1 Tax=Kitasatospora sp. NPDC002040 TaxID=3154661 RepID=UPI00331B7417
MSASPEQVRAEAAELLCRPLVPADRPAVLDLLTASLAGGPTGTRSAEFFDWKHRRNPFGSSPGLVAVTPAGRIVGVRLFLRWEWQRDGQVVRAVRPVDTATHPDFQGRGIFRRLTTQLLEQVSPEAELVFNTPNGNSLPGYLRMGWRDLGQIPVTLRVARPLSFARGARAALTRRRAAAGPVRCELPTAADWFGTEPLAGLLAERAAADAPDHRLAVLRTEEFLRWRYGDAPGLDYRVITCHRGNELSGVAFGRPRRRGPLVEFTLADVIVRPGDGGSAARLLRAAARAGGDHVATHLAPGTEAAGAALRVGYLRAPRTGLRLAARTPDGSPPPEPGAYRFTLGDLEVF